MKVEAFIANKMCELTRDVLWLPRREWALSKRKGGELTIKPGNGSATYVQTSRSGSGPIKLTFGQKMIAEAMNPNHMSNWLQAREIMEHGYFDGKVTALNSLAHVVIHEFGHVVQAVMGARHARSVHNEAFYKILDKAHRNGHADRIREELHAACAQQGVDLSVITPHIRPGASSPGLQMAEVFTGQELFSRSAKLTHLNPFQVVKKNRTTVLVKSTTTGEIFKGNVRAFHLTPD